MAPTNTGDKKLKSPKLLRSYLAKISDATKAGSMAAFTAFPQKVKFDGQDRGEYIVIMLRQHVAVLVPQIFLIILTLLLPIVILPLLGYFELEVGISEVSMGFGVAVLWAMLIITASATLFFKWFFNVNIVTNERIIDIDFRNVASHRVSEAQLEKIEDISHSPAGVWAAIFDFGSVYIQTAAEQREFTFENVPRPRDVQDTLNDLLELKQNA